MGSMHLVKFPPVAICVQESHVLNGWVDITHVLKTPYSTAYYLSKIERLGDKWRVHG